MMTESIILMILVVTMSYLTLRSGRRGTALVLLPLLIVPGANVLGYGLAPYLDMLTTVLGPEHWRLLFVLAALAVTMCVVGAISRNIKRKGFRRGSLFLCGGFSLVFSFLILVAEFPNL